MCQFFFGVRTHHVMFLHLALLFVVLSIDFQYQIEGLTGCFHMNPTITLPITIGSYPIQDEPPNYSSSMLASAILNARISRSRSTQQQQPPQNEQNSRNGDASSFDSPFPENGQCPNAYIDFVDFDIVNKMMQYIWLEWFQIHRHMSRRLKLTEPNSHPFIRYIVDKHPIQAKRIHRL